MNAGAVLASFDRRALVLPAAFVAAWVLLSASRLANPHLVVPPRVAVSTLVQSLTGSEYWIAVGSSLARLGIGFGAGALAGIAAGLVLGTNGTAEKVGAPSLHSARQVALFAWIPLLTAWFGDGEVTKIVLIALAAFFPVALNTEAGCRTVPQALVEVGRVLEFDRRTMLRRVVIPSATRSIATGLQVGLATAWIGTIGAEYLINQGHGIGVALSGARIDNRMDLVLVYMLTLALTGLALNALVRRGVTAIDD